MNGASTRPGHGAVGVQWLVQGRGTLEPRGWKNVLPLPSSPQCVQWRELLGSNCSMTRPSQGPSLRGGVLGFFLHFIGFFGC